MNESQLAKTAISISIIGIIALSIVLALERPQAPSLAKACSQDKSYISINGTISKVSSGNITRLTIISTSEVKVVIFANSSLKKGQTIEVFGSLKEYNGNIELVADKLLVK